MKVISVSRLSKEYRRLKKSRKWRILREYEVLKVVDSVSFEVNRGETVGYLGPNGAGKSTTIKLLTGILVPTSGQVSVLGYIPSKQRYEYTYHIGVILGQRSLLWWDLPVLDSLKLYGDIYELSKEEFKNQVEMLSEILDLEEIFHIPVRQLSLGQRMKCEFAASLLHKPDVIFMDEPMIGLDVLVKENVRNFIRKINKVMGTTIFLTTHDMNDVEELCNRVIIMDKGRVIYDDSLLKLMSEHVKWKIIEFEFSKIHNSDELKRTLRSCEIVRRSNTNWEVRVPLGTDPIPQIVEGILGSCTVKDISIHAPKLEEIIRDIYLRNGGI